jgi:CRISPR-associated endonuclease/helicase Cas3
MGSNLRYYNENAPYAGQFCLNQALKLAGKAFEVFDNSSQDVIVPYGKGRELIAELAGHPHPDLAFLASWERKARAYSVSVYDWQLKKLGNAVVEYAGVAVLAEGYYDEYTGLMTGSRSKEFLEV